MKKKTLTAVLFMVIAILVSIPWGANRSFARLRDKVEDSYYYDSTGYAIYEGLEARQDAARNLLTVAQRYSGPNPELEPLMDRLDYQVKRLENLWAFEDLAQAIAVNAQLGEAAQALADKLEEIGLSEKDEKYPRMLLADLDAEQDKLERSSYNDEARAYNEKLSGIPVRYLRWIAGLKELGVFEA